jgi:hypothetical protein
MNDVTPERWLPVVGYEGYYEVSDHGRVRSSRRRRGSACRVLKPQRLMNSCGYVSVHLSMRNVQKMHYVHALVAAAFIGPRPTGLEIRHLNGDAADNRLKNLAYGTHIENARDMIRHGNSGVGVENKNARLTDATVVEIRAARQQGATQTSLAVRYGVSRATIYRAVTRQYWKHVA